MINCQVSPSKKLRKYCEDVDKHASIKYNEAGTAAFKKRRLFLKQRKSELRHKNEWVEGTTYESSASLRDNILDTLQLAVIDEKAEPIIRVPALLLKIYVVETRSCTNS